jgi:dTDP-4-dehydrorhamnose 3,5-epimerase-like enzyme
MNEWSGSCLIEGVKIVPVPTFVDDRGFINQIIQASDGVFPKLERLYIVGNFGKGIIRGFHKHEKEWKCFFVIKGAAKFVLVKEKSKTMDDLETDTFTLSSNNPSLLIVPPGIFNGWMSLEEQTIVLGVSNFAIDETKKDDFRVDPYTWGDVWKVKNR